MAEPDRETLKRQFLAEAGLSDAVRTTMAGDASTRLYERLRRTDGSSVILMDQPPAAESEPAPPDATPEERRAKGYNALARLAAGRVDAFVVVAAYLKDQGFSAPEVLAFDVGHGLAVLEDLGDDLYATLLADGANATPLYEAAVDLLVALHAFEPPMILKARGLEWPLSTYDDLALRTYTELFLDWWPQYAELPPFPPEARQEWDRCCAPIRRTAEAGASVFAHRDFHAENLLWLPKRSGLAKVGLLDFQDAVKAHPAWDLLHLLQDARRDVPAVLEAQMLDRYLAKRPDLDVPAFLADYRALAALNAARILGPIFARQVVHFGRPKYIAFMPRTWRYLERNLAHPELGALKAWFDRWTPPDTRP